MIDPKIHLVFISMFLSWMATPAVVATAQTSPILSATNPFGSHLELAKRAPQPPANHSTMKRRHAEFIRRFYPHQHLAARADSGLQTYETCSVPKSFALTFDDGPTHLSEELDRKLAASPGAKVSYFINGNNFGCIYDHADVLLKRFNQGAILGLTSTSTKLQVLREKGYKGMVMWSDDSRDSATPAPSPSEIISKYQSLSEKAIILNHETHEFMVEETVPSILRVLKSKNFKLLTAPDCLELGSNQSDWYKFVQEPGTRDDSWTCAGSPAPGQFD